MTRVDVFWGGECLHGLGPLLKHSSQHNTLTFDAHGAHILLMGDQDVLVSPIICNEKIHAIINNNEINHLSLCYLMPPSFDPTVWVSDVSKAKSFYAIISCTGLTKNTPTRQHCVDDKENEQLLLLLRSFCNVFLDDLPFGLPRKRIIMHGIDLLQGSKTC